MNPAKRDDTLARVRALRRTLDNPAPAAKLNRRPKPSRTRRALMALREWVALLTRWMA